MVALAAAMEGQVSETPENKIKRLEAQLEFTHTHYQKVLEQVHRELAVTARHSTFRNCLHHPCY